jgi:hypothetical protein
VFKLEFWAQAGIKIAIEIGPLGHLLCDLEELRLVDKVDIAQEVTCHGNKTIDCNIN